MATPTPRPPATTHKALPVDREDYAIRDALDDTLARHGWAPATSRPYPADGVEFTVLRPTGPDSIVVHVTPTGASYTVVATRTEWSTNRTRPGRLIRTATLHVDAHEAATHRCDLLATEVARAAERTATATPVVYPYPTPTR